MSPTTKSVVLSEEVKVKVSAASFEVAPFKTSAAAMVIVGGVLSYVQLND